MSIVFAASVAAHPAKNGFRRRPHFICRWAGAHGSRTFLRMIFGRSTVALHYFVQHRRLSCMSAYRELFSGNASERLSEP